jgi:hypothetical protein
MDHRRPLDEISQLIAVGLLATIASCGGDPRPPATQPSQAQTTARPAAALLAGRVVQTPPAVTLPTAALPPEPPPKMNVVEIGRAHV